MIGRFTIAGAGALCGAVLGTGLSVISDASFQALSGHFFSGVIAVTGEFQLRANAVEVRRELDAGIGLKLMRFA